MADEAHLKILRQGVEPWNRWRKNPRIVPNLVKADLSGADLMGADFHRAILSGANLRWADLRQADLSGADLTFVNLFRAYLRGADLRGANLSGADLSGSDLSGSDLSKADLGGAVLHGAKISGADLTGAYLGVAKISGADLSGADLSGADLSKADLGRAHIARADLRGANLSGADLSGADLTRANLSDARLNEADFSGAEVGGTMFAGTDLSAVKGLETVWHEGPSTVGVDTLFNSHGDIPPDFLRGCGLSNWQIEAAKLYRPDLTNEQIGDILYRVHDLRASRPLQISSLFISYSHADGTFVDHVERYLVESGIRFWRDVHHATAGRLERQVDRAVRLNPTVLLVLSENAVESDWVEHEVRLARKLEKETKRDVLCPVALDDSWKECRWPERLREQITEYNILNFSGWEDSASFDRMYRRLVEGLNLFYQGEGT